MICNVFIIGKTGAGKSSLLNYLGGNITLEKAGVGTETGGITEDFQAHRVEFNGLDCVLIDSEGYEVSKIQEWEQLVYNKINDYLNADNTEEGFPVILYCIDGGGSRFVDFDAKIIEKLCTLNIGIVPVITKADLCSKEELLDMGRSIWEKYKDIFAVPVSSSKNDQNKYDIINLSKAIIEAWGKSAKNRFADFIYHPVLEEFEQWEVKVRQWITSQNLGFLALSKLELIKKINSKLEKKIEDINISIKNRTDNAVNAIMEINRKVEHNKSDVFMKAFPDFVLKTSQINTNTTAHGKVVENISMGVFAIGLLSIWAVPIALVVSKQKKKMLQQLEESFAEQCEKIKENCIEQKIKFEKYMKE